MTKKPNEETEESVCARALTTAVETYIAFPTTQSASVLTKLMGEYQTAWVLRRAIAERVEKK